MSSCQTIVSFPPLSTLIISSCDSPFSIHAQVVWNPTPKELEDSCVPMLVPKVLAQFLRPHQRAGVEFCCECLLGLKDFKGNGCILADDSASIFLKSHLTYFFAIHRILLSKDSMLWAFL